LKKTRKLQGLIRTTAKLFIIIMLLFSILLPVLNGVIIDTGVDFDVENETYRVNAAMNFSRIIIADTYIIFNNTGFNVTSPSNILITLRHINDSTITSVSDSRIIEFEVYLVSGTTTISISGFAVNILYNIYLDSVSDSSFVSNSTGCIDITVDSGVSYIFTVYRGGNSAPVISGEFPSDGATNIPVGGSPVNVYLTDSDSNLMNVSIWSDFTGSWTQITYPVGLDVWRLFMLDYDSDGDWEADDLSAFTTDPFNQDSGRYGFYGNMSVTDDWGMTNYSTIYSWSVNVTDGIDWTNETFSFTTEGNTAPVISSPSPGDGVYGVSVGTTSLSVSIADSEDTFNWTITTSPDIGSSSGNDESNGVKTCTIAGLNYDGFYTWTVSVTDGVSWTNTTYDFTVESDPGGGPPPNSAPTISNPYPSDESTMVHLTPICHVFVADANLDSIDVNFYHYNETGVWFLMQTNSSVSSGNTVYWNYTNVTDYETTYNWKVTAYDGTINISKTYNFTTSINTPQVNWTLPVDGAVDVSIAGVTINAELFDYQDDNLRVSIWSNYTGSWVQYAGRDVYLDGTAERWEAFLFDYNGDGGWNFQDNGLWHLRNGWGASGNWGFWVASNEEEATYYWNMTEYGETYFISLNISDNSTNRAWNNYTFSFTTELNTAPTITDPIPRDGKRWISVYTTNLSVVISDANSLFNYTIETDPNIGSISANNVDNGVKGCTISGLNFSTTYTWYVNATDGEDWDNKSYTFTTKSETDYDIENFIDNLPEFAFGPYMIYVSDFVWVFLFIGMIGLVYGASKNVGATLVAILLTFAAYGGKRAFVDGMGQQVSLMFSVIAAICLTVLILGLFLSKRRG